MSGTVTETKPITKLQQPPMFKVIYMNDNRTTFQFVIESLQSHFDYAETTAEKIANEINVEGSAVAAVMPFEIAEQKGIEITVEARKQGFPLQIRIEKDI